MPDLIQQLEYVAPQRLEWREVAAPAVRDPQDAIIRPLVVATCDVDAAIVHGLTPYQPPFPFGHECVAEVVTVGDGAGSLSPGDRVCVPFQVSCGECARCRRGATGFCERVPARASFFGIGDGARNWGGLLADLVRVPWASHMLVRLPDGIDPLAAASASDNLPDAYRAVAPPLEELPGARVLICGGSGAIDLYAVMIALALGAAGVDYASPSPRRCAAAAKLGANAIETGFGDPLGPYPVTVDASARIDGLRRAILSTEATGICTSTAVHFEPAELPLLDLFFAGISFRLAMQSARPTIPAVLELIAAGGIDPREIAPLGASWAEAPEALATHRFKLLISRMPGVDASQEAEFDNPTVSG